ncbi:hypothetical protein K443DRAFT_74733, partial [Laccaria amethystina LaAM-08-1]
GFEVLSTSHGTLWLDVPVLRMEIRRLRAMNEEQRCEGVNVAETRSTAVVHFDLLPTTNRNDTPEDEHGNKNVYTKTQHSYLTRERH